MFCSAIEFMFLTVDKQLQSVYNLPVKLALQAIPAAFSSLLNHAQLSKHPV